MAGIFDLSKTPGSNTALINIGTIAAPGDVDDAIRTLASHLAKWRDDLGGQPSSGGSANAQTLTTNSVLVSGTLIDGAIVGFTAGFTNTSAMTLNCDGLGATDVKRYSHAGLVALTGGEVQAGGKYLVAFEATGSDWILLNPSRVGVWEPVADTSISVAAAFVDFTPLSAYRALRFHFMGIRPQTDAVFLGMRVAVGGVAQDSASSYGVSVLQMGMTSGLSAWGSGTGLKTMINLCQIGNDTGETASGVVTLSNFNASARTWATWQIGSVIDSGEFTQFTGVATDGGAACDGVRILMSTGNIETGGRIVLEGLR